MNLHNMGFGLGRQGMQVTDMCYSPFNNGICNGTISITLWGFINGYYI